MPVSRAVLLRAACPLTSITRLRRAQVGQPSGRPTPSAGIACDCALCARVSLQGFRVGVGVGVGCGAFARRY
eukprot:6043548-Alexandrium_andersonii.AAC.1